MASGGMEWAYRVLGSHKLDALGAAIVLHLGWRDAPNYRSDRGIASALGFDRASVRRATAKLAALGIIQRCPKGLMWLASETVAIVRGDAAAPEPDAKHRDKGAGASSPRGPQAPGGGGLKPPQAGASSPPKRKENIEKRARASSSRSASRPASPAKGQAGRVASGGGEVDLSSLSPFQLSRVRSGQSLPVAGLVIQPDTPQFVALVAALRAAENRAVA